MRHFFVASLFYLALSLSALLVFYIFVTLIAMPVAYLLMVALVITWLLPRPWRWLVPLAIVGEVVTSAQPLALTTGVLSPLLIFWLRGRTEVDVSFSYLVLAGASAALGLALIVGIGTYPHWLHIPWLIVLQAWLAVTGGAAAISIFLPSLYSHYLHGRYF